MSPAAVAELAPSRFGPLTLGGVVLARLIAPLTRALGGRTEVGARHGARHHDCPGRCGREVPNWRHSCRSCWWSLPLVVREHLIRTAGLRDGDPARLAALTAAARYFLGAHRAQR